MPAAMVPPGARPRPRAPAPWVPRAGWGTGRGRRRPPGRWRAASTGLPASFPSVPLPPGVTDVSGNGSAQPGRRPRGTGNVCRGATCSDRQPGRAAASGLRRGGLLRQPRRVGPCPSPASHGLATGRCSPRLGPPVTVHGPGRRAWGPAAQRETHTLQDGGPARGASGAHGLGPSGGAVGSRPPREQGHQNPPAPQPTSFIGRRRALGGFQGASSGSLVGARALPPLRPAAGQPPEICGRTGDSVSRRKPLLQNRGSGGPTEDTSPPSLFKACPYEGTAGQGGVGVPRQPTRHRQPGDVQRLGHVPGHQLPTRWLDRWGGGSRGPC